MTYKTLALALFSMLLMLVPASADDLFNFISADQLKTRIENKTPIILVDIQRKPAYKEHHFFDSIRTFAYPAKDPADLNSLVQAVYRYKVTKNPVIIISPRGGAASKRTYSFLVDRGIPAEKLFVLVGGIQRWPFKEMLLHFQEGAGCE